MHTRISFFFTRSPSRSPYNGLSRLEESAMSKGMDRKKEGKKKPAKSFDEKRAAKKEKKANRGFRV